MVNWLTKATEALRKPPPPEPEPYDVSCACTHRISGMRLTAFQVVRCNRCGNFVFVLPQDVYPKPAPKAKKKAPPKSPFEAARDSAGSLQTMPPAVPSRQNLPPTGAKVAEKPAPAASSTKPAPASASEIRIEAIEVAPQLKRSVFSPVRLVAFAIFGVVALTGYLIWQGQLKEKAALTLRQHLEAGETALHAGKYADAATEYQLASEAVDRLGRDDVESRGVRQKAKELNAIAHLSSLSLYELCEDARLAVAAGDSKWSERFDRLHKNSWVVIEGDVVSDAGSDGTPQALIRYPFPIIGNAQVILDARLKALQPTSATAAPQHVMFAAQLVSFAEEGPKNKVWVLKFNDASAFLWTGTDTYRALGLGADDLRSDDETSRLLAAQAEIVGVKP
jgi:hypothetical protein